MSSRRACKTSCSYVFKTSWKTKKCYTEDVFSTSSPRQMFAGNQFKGSRYIFKSTIVCHCLGGIFIFFERLMWLSLPWSRWYNFEFDLEICKENQNVYTLMLSVFLLKIATGLWGLCPNLSVHVSLQLDSVDIKTDSKNAVRKVLDLAEKWKTPIIQK